MVRRAGPADARGIAEVHVASWRHAYPGLVPQAYLDAMDVSEHAARWERLLVIARGLVHVVEEGGRVVGFASGGPEREGDPVFRGELYAVYLLPEHQRRGLGRRLVGAVAASLAEAGMPAMLLWVLRDNAPARAFYERLGGEYLREHGLDLAGAALLEVAYGWRDTSALIALAGGS